MIDEGYFVISYPEDIKAGTGSISLSDTRSDNYYESSKNETLCCVCDKVTIPWPIPFPDPFPF